ncbi:UbiA family prenyltransferase [Rugamonas sp.]|uniref:UbiA family prenyltransferase n=1 Tax=Rugamonas sp. TaxID=1926287 RepID=UPI002600F775|nr:UbiA family prenyltransferase [Rugamonas sp.]
MSGAAAVRDAVPLVVDLDGTLLRSDMLLESALAFVRAAPQRALAPLWWLAGGKAALKRRLAEQTDIDVTTLPYDPRVLALIERERALGRTIVLATASDRLLAERIAAHLGLFDEVLASDGGVNLSAGRKRDALLARYGRQGYDYAGNSADDLPVWATARHACVVGAGAGLLRRARACCEVAEVLPPPPARARLRTLLKALRVHQWSKNLLLFLPLLAAHQGGDPLRLLAGMLAFLCFSLCASSVYLLNDLLDVADDRHHKSKRARPFAAGSLSLLTGVALAPLLLIAAFGLAGWLLPWRFSAVLGGYYALTLAYTLHLKRVMGLDAITLAALYTLRLIAGAAAFDVPLTFWMLAFSMFMFLSLALVKRYAELREARSRGDAAQARGRGYFPGDLDMIASLGAASGYLAVLVLALYTQDHATVALYRRPQLIWLACPLLLLWITRTWMLTHRGLMHDDPVVFAMKDRTSLVIGLLFAAIFGAAA